MGNLRGGRDGIAIICSVLLSLWSLNYLPCAHLLSLLDQVKIRFDINLTCKCIAMNTMSKPTKQRGNLSHQMTLQLDTYTVRTCLSIDASSHCLVPSVWLHYVHNRYLGP